MSDVATFFEFDGNTFEISEPNKMEIRLADGPGFLIADGVIVAVMDSGQTFTAAEYIAPWRFDQTWETEGGRQWRIVSIDWRYAGRGIVAREVTPGAINRGRVACFTADGQQVDGPANLVREVRA